MDRDAVHRLLHDDAHRARGRPRDVTDRAIAHGVYRPLGFTPIAHPDRWMERPGTPRG
ncbi:MAG TPA: hypothetical protein VGP02_19125 [Mycobacteriales bacterium]|nr:hypothetical protein [Mycobacteriales bacterium]